MRASHHCTPPLRLGLLVEVAPGGACLGHIPALPGFCLRAEAPEELPHIGVERIAVYARWLLAEDLAGLTAETAAVAEYVRAGRQSDIRLVEAERRDGSRVWLSGNPAALFESDHHVLDDAGVHARLRFVRGVVQRMGFLVECLTPAQRMRKLTDSQRSVNETLTHIGNCVWWYCSRIDDSLPEPEERFGGESMDRVRRLLDLASMFLLGVSVPRRGETHVPSRFPTSDPDEPWTHTKVCRRQAEHVWEHLPGLTRAVELVGGRDQQHSVR